MPRFDFGDSEGDDSLLGPAGEDGEGGGFLGLFGGGQPGDELDDRAGPNAATGQPVQPDDDGALDDDRTDDGDTADADFPAGGAFGFLGLLGSGPSGVWVPVPGEGATGGDADGGAPALGFNTQAGGHFFGDDEPGGLDVAGTLFSGGLPFGGGDGDDGTSFPLAGDTDTFPLSGDTNTFPLGAGQSQTVTAGFFDLGGAPPAGAPGSALTGSATTSSPVAAGALGETGLSLLGLETPDGVSSADDAESQVQGGVFGFLGAAGTGDGDLNMNIFFPWVEATGAGVSSNGGSASATGGGLFGSDTSPFTISEQERDAARGSSNGGSASAMAAARAQRPAVCSRTWPAPDRSAKAVGRRLPLPPTRTPKMATRMRAVRTSTSSAA